MLKPTIFAAALALSAMPGTAFAWIASNGLIVKPTGEASFEVPYRGESGQSEFWCAAGDYVRRALHLPGNTRIYRTSSVPRRAGHGISFSLSSEGAQPSGLAVFGGGRGITATHARSLCVEGRKWF